MRRALLALAAAAAAASCFIPPLPPHSPRAAAARRPPRRPLALASNPSRAARKSLYRSLRRVPAASLWRDEAPRFALLPPDEREARAPLLRALALRFAASPDADARAAVGAWLAARLADPSEVVRRYAARALLRLADAAPPAAEAALLRLAAAPASAAEAAAVSAALGALGGDATRAALAAEAAALPAEAAVRVHARAAAAAAAEAEEGGGGVDLDGVLRAEDGGELVLTCRRGLEAALAAEVEEGRAPLRLLGARDGAVLAAATRDFRLAELYALRCFDAVGFPLECGAEGSAADRLAAAIASPRCLRLMGALRATTYRLHLSASPGLRAAAVAAAAFALAPAALNAPRGAQCEVHASATRDAAAAELRPRVRADPRRAYRAATFYAGAHPPLAAAMALLAGRQPNEIVWDPFCGTGVELVECALRLDVEALCGSDRHAAPLAVAAASLRASGAAPRGGATWLAADFRAAAQLLPPPRERRVSLIISNPPLGRRVKVANLHALFADLFVVAAGALRDGGRMVIVNPLRAAPREGSTLVRESRRTVDLGLRHGCSVEVWRQRL
ncbi:hypothetical protein AB1Y20_002430 [Prymnesium parvum]|uniref:Ribosomal RNA large subunit methyltransferase K/L-like methyltransferase domain-containing protein n=1 Tax=Prymnesium parvum TaxID=97485 RepID=A0AB34JBB7_PRYPA